MSETSIKPVEDLIEALNFYSDPDNYWSNPLDLESNHCRRTLKDVRASEKGNKVLQDRGVRARQAIKDFHFAISGEKLTFVGKHGKKIEGEGQC